MSKATTSSGYNVCSSTALSMLSFIPSKLFPRYVYITLLNPINLSSSISILSTTSLVMFNSSSASPRAHFPYVSAHDSFSSYMVSSGPMTFLNSRYCTPSSKPCPHQGFNVDRFDINVIDKAGHSAPQFINFLPPQPCICRSTFGCITQCT